MTAMPPMLLETQRLLFDDNIWRDAVRQPIYSSVGYDNAAIPSERQFFGYARGQNVPGAGNAAGIASTMFNTNMDSAGQLGRPKKFRCDRIGVHMLAINFSGSGVPAVGDASSGTATAAASTNLVDALFLFYSTLLQVKVGDKLYCDHPSFFLPSNMGIGGVAAVSIDNTGATAVQQLSVGLPHGVGWGWAMPMFPFLIEDQQPIEAVLRCPYATGPTLLGDRLVFVILDGNLYRAVQ